VAHTCQEVWPGNVGQGGVALYEEECIHVIAAVKFGLADWGEVGGVALRDFKEATYGGMLSRCIQKQLSRKDCSKGIPSNGTSKQLLLLELIAESCCHFFVEIAIVG